MAKYHAEFIGRTRGAIGIFYTIRTFVEGDTPDAARMALYERYEHIQGLSMMELPIRYVATRINSDGVRQLASAMQGRHTYATPEEAQAWIDAVKANNSEGA